MSKPIKEAVNTLRAAFRDDPAFARSWHDNLAMSFFDAQIHDEGASTPHAVANDGATRFMKLAFGADTSGPTLSIQSPASDLGGEA